MKCCNADVIRVKTLDDYRLYLQFEDGLEGEIDISSIVPFNGVFEALKDKNYFNKVRVNSDIGTICWKNGADLSPECLYKKIKAN